MENFTNASIRQKKVSLSISSIVDAEGSLDSFVFFRLIVKTQIGFSLMDVNERSTSLESKVSVSENVDSVGQRISTLLRQPQNSNVEASQMSLLNLRSRRDAESLVFRFLRRSIVIAFLTFVLESWWLDMPLSNH